MILDARYERVRKAGAIVSQAVPVAIGIDLEGRRNVLARFLERRGLLERDVENSDLVYERQAEDVMQQLYGYCATYRIAVGSHQGRKIFTLQTLPPLVDSEGSGQAAKVAGFSLHAGVLAEAHRRGKLERPYRYVSRPAVSEKRMALTPNGKIRYPLKTPCPDDTTHVLFEPLDFIARLAAMASRWNSVRRSNIHALLCELKPMKISLNSSQSHY